MNAKNLESERRIPALFDAKSLGRSFREIAVDYIETEDSHLKSRWFQAEADADLFIWADVSQKVESETGEIIKYQLCFCGQVVEWSVFDGVRTGLIVESEVVGSDVNSESIEFDKTPQASSMNQARQLLPYISGLEKPEVDLLTNLLKVETQRAPQHKPVSLRYPKQKTATPRSTWQNLMHWISSINKK